MRLLFISALPLFLAACASPAHHKQATMHNPDTGETQRCEIDPWASWQWNYKSELEQCINSYEAIGFERVDHP